MKGLGAFLSLVVVFLALNQLLDEDRMFYFRWVGISSLILVFGRSAVDFILVYLAARSRALKGKLYLTKRALLTSLRGFYICILGSLSVVLLFASGDNYLYAILIAASAPMQFVGSVVAELSKGFGKPIFAAVFGDVLPSLPVVGLLFFVFLDMTFSLGYFVAAFFSGAVLSMCCAIFYLIYFVRLEGEDSNFAAPNLELDQSTLLVTNLISDTGVKHGLVILFSLYGSSAMLGLYVLLQRVLTLYRMTLQAAESFWIRDLITELADKNRFWAAKSYKPLLGLSFGSSMLVFITSAILAEWILGVAKVEYPGGVGIFISGNLLFLLCGLMPSSRKIASYQLSTKMYLSLAIANCALFLAATVGIVVIGDETPLLFLLPIFILWQSFSYLSASVYFGRRV
jgi:hypothetical protein